MLLVTANKEVEATVDHVQQQALVGADPLGAEALIEVKVQVRPHERWLLPSIGPALSPALGQQVQLQPVFRLQMDDQLVVEPGGGIEDGVRRGAEIHNDTGVTARQPLAGSNVKRDTGPAPIGDLGAQRDKGFGPAVGRNAGLVAVPWHGAAGNGSRGVLTSHHMLGQGLRRPRAQRAQHLEFFVADRVGF